MTNQRSIGTTYETKASEYLEKQGYQIVVHNYRCFFGEIDIIAKDVDMLVFVEVKYRHSNRKGNSLEAVHLKKQKVIAKVALQYLQSHHAMQMPCRFDVIGFDGESQQLTHIKDAFRPA